VPDEDARCVLCRFETALRVLPDTRSAAGSPRSRDYDRVNAALFRVLEHCCQDAAPYTPPAGDIPPNSRPGGPSGRVSPNPRQENDD
jgi:hypothetical protein